MKRLTRNRRRWKGEWKECLPARGRKGRGVVLAGELKKLEGIIEWFRHERENRYGEMKVVEEEEKLKLKLGFIMVVVIPGELSVC